MMIRDGLSSLRIVCTRTRYTIPPMSQSTWRALVFVVVFACLEIALPQTPNHRAVLSAWAWKELLERADRCRSISFRAHILTMVHGENDT